MYEDRIKWSFPFQSHIGMTMLKLHKKRTAKPIKIMERSIFSGKYIFTEALFRAGVMGLPMYSLLNDWYDFMLESHPVKVDRIGNDFKKKNF